VGVRVAVREVESHDVGARADERTQGVGVAAAGAERRDDLRAASLGIVQDDPCCALDSSRRSTTWSAGGGRTSTAMPKR
jgi:hypothetical protein